MRRLCGDARSRAYHCLAVSHRNLTRFMHGWKRTSSFRIRKWYRENMAGYFDGFGEGQTFWQPKYYSFEIYSTGKLEEKLHSIRFVRDSLTKQSTGVGVLLAGTTTGQRLECRLNGSAEGLLGNIGWQRLLANGVPQAASATPWQSDQYSRRPSTWGSEAGAGCHGLARNRIAGRDNGPVLRSKVRIP